MRNAPFDIGPSNTPKVIKGLVAANAALSFLWALSIKIFPIFSFYYLQYALTLTTDGIRHGFIWELLTFFFVHPAPGGITFSFLIGLAFTCYLLWVFGSSLIHSKGIKQFLILFFSGGIVTGIFVSIPLLIFNIPYPFVGSHVCVFSLLMAWMILNPNARIFLFFTLPVNVVWLILGLWGINLLVDLAQGDLIHFTAYLISGLYGYLYALFFWRHHSPLKFMRGFEDFIIRLRTPRKKRDGKSKVYDFKTGKPVSEDDAFMDEMLTKISLKGKESLSKKEKARMEKISKKKRRN